MFAYASAIRFEASESESEEVSEEPMTRRQPPTLPTNWKRKSNKEFNIQIIKKKGRHGKVRQIHLFPVKQQQREREPERDESTSEESHTFVNHDKDEQSVSDTTRVEKMIDLERAREREHERSHDRARERERDHHDHHDHHDHIASESHIHPIEHKQKIKIKHHHHHHHHNHVKTVVKKEPYPVEKIVHVPKPYPVEKIVQVPVEKVVHVPKIVEKLVHVPKPYPVEKVVEKLIHIPKPYPVKEYVERKVPYPVEKVVEKIVHVPKPYPVIKHVPYEIKVPVPVERPVPYTIEKKVPYPVEVKVPYEVEKKIPYPVKVFVPQPYPVEKRPQYHHPQHHAHSYDHRTDFSQKLSVSHPTTSSEQVSSTEFNEYLTRPSSQPTKLFSPYHKPSSEELQRRPYSQQHQLHHQQSYTQVNGRKDVNHQKGSDEESSSTEFQPIIGQSIEDSSSNNVETVVLPPPSHSPSGSLRPFHINVPERLPHPEALTKSITHHTHHTDASVSKNNQFQHSIEIPIQFYRLQPFDTFQGHGFAIAA